MGLFLVGFFFDLSSVLTMKLNIANPATGCQKLIECDDERKLRAFMDKRMSAQVEGDSLGDEFKGYIFRISGGNDKQGFPMKQGVLIQGRTKLLLKKGHSCFRERRTGERKRKSVRGCIVGQDLSVLNLVIVKKGDAELPGLTDEVKPRRLGPKRASKIRKLFNLNKTDDVRKYVIRREIEGKKTSKAPKIQRLVTPVTLQRKRRRFALKKLRAAKNKTEAAEYANLLAQRTREARVALMSKKSRSVRVSTMSVKEEPKATKADAKKTAGKAAPKNAVDAKKAGKTADKKAGKAGKTVADKKAGKTAAKPAAAKGKTAAAKPAAKPAAAKPAAATKPAAAKSAGKAKAGKAGKAKAKK